MISHDQRPVESASPPWCRILVAVPPDGFGQQLAVMRAWLDQNCGHGRWDTAAAGTAGVVNNAVAFYFADPAAARAFVARFSCGYHQVNLGFNACCPPHFPREAL